MRSKASKEALLRSLQSQSAAFPQVMREIEIAVANEEYRKAFLMIVELKNQGLWKPDLEDERNLEDFWWEYAN